MPKLPLLTFAIHDLNTWGGQDRSTLEIARILSFRRPIEIVAYTLDDPRFPSGWGSVTFRPVPTFVRRPVALKTIFFYLVSFFTLARGQRIVQSTGACSLRSDVVQVQFIHRAWRKTRESLPPEAPRSWIHGLYHAVLERFDVAMERLLFRRKKTYIAISNVVARELADHFGIRENVHVIHHGVDPEVFSPADAAFAPDRARLRGELGIATDDLVIVFVGAYARKGLDASIRAMSLIPAEARRGVKLLAIGGGDTARFAALARELGVSEYVVLATPKKPIAPYYRLSDLFLLPTLYEPFGLVILEALACGLPAVVSRSAGGSELMTDGREGYWIERPEDPREIADRLLPLLTDAGLRARMGAAARALGERYTWTHVAGEYEKVFGRIRR